MQSRCLPCHHLKSSNHTTAPAGLQKIKRLCRAASWTHLSPTQGCQIWGQIVYFSDLNAVYWNLLVKSAQFVSPVPESMWMSRRVMTLWTGRFPKEPKGSVPQHEDDDHKISCFFVIALAEITMFGSPEIICKFNKQTTTHRGVCRNRVEIPALKDSPLYSILSHHYKVQGNLPEFGVWNHIIHCITL